jgi:hypothetical protein
MDNNHVLHSNGVPDYIVDWLRPNYIKINKYFFLYEFEDPLTHQVIISPRLLFICTQLAIEAKGKFKILRAYDPGFIDDDEKDCYKDSHKNGMSVDLVPVNIDKDALAAICKRVGFDIVIVTENYLHCQITLNDYKDGPTNAT